MPDPAYGLQMLYGMAEPVHAAVRRLGLRLRVYAPVGELIPGMAYLVRRLLENTANESILRRQFLGNQSRDELLKPPEVTPTQPSPLKGEGKDLPSPGVPIALRGTRCSSAATG